ncbi:MAG: hypothetical protein Ct9H300mP23_08340 [Nitrospinota bacterium]|nr:MAG: hypothetical protein Ct9H300mP23_08340 [Nitrospinota bacterium]
MLIIPFGGLMGGPMDVWDVEKYPWLVQEKEAIRFWVKELKRPFLGLSWPPVAGRCTWREVCSFRTPRG